MDNIITKKGNEYVVLTAMPGRCVVILKEKYDGPVFNARDKRTLCCNPDELAGFLDQLGF